MAKGGSETLSKRNSKLESFLKLNLSQHVFERIRTYEACIVNFRKEKRAFKFAILSDERIYLTENPPKNIHEEDAVNLGDVLSIDLVNEFPEFLNGEERENAQHIQVIYQQRAPQKAVTPEGSPGRRRTASVDPRENGVNPAAVPNLLVTEPDNTTSRCGQQPRLSDGLPLPPNNGVKLHRSFDESEMRALKELQLFDSSESEDDRLSLSCPSPDLRELSQTSSLSSIESLNSSLSRKGRRNKLVTVDTIRPLPQRPSGHRGSSEDSRVSPKMAGIGINGGETPSQFPLATHRSLPSPDEVFRSQKKESFKFLTPFHENNNNTVLPSGRKLSLVSSTSSSGSTISKPSSKKKNKSFHELHLFILSQSSPFLMHLRSAWSNLVIKSTLLLDSQESERCKTSSSPSSKQLVHQYNQLKQEILDSNGSMEALFHLMQELTNAAEKYYSLKKLFWKSDDLIKFIISTLQSYLPKSSVDVITENDRHKRADELELAILMIESLGLMLHDTEVVPNRLVILRSKSGKIVLDLLDLLTCLPEIPQRWRPPSLEAHRLIQTDADVWESSTDAEVSKLVQELTNASTAVLYELILITQQANWGGDESQYMNLGWLIQSLLSRRTVTFNFLGRLLAQSMKLLLPSRAEILPPVQAVLLYQQFTVLQTLLVNSSIISAHVRRTYVEEFRYYVQSPHIVSKLPAHYSITRHTLRLIDDVLRHVLESEVSILKG